jgi:hypothetical protein
MKKIVFVLLTIVAAAYAKAAETIIAVVPKATLPIIITRYNLQLHGLEQDSENEKKDFIEIQLNNDELKDLYQYLKSENMIKSGISSDSVICGGSCVGN